jgi:urease subunit alpha
MRPMFGAFGGALARGSLSFVSQASLASGAVEGYGLHKRLAVVKGCRVATKRDMVHNAYLPAMQIDPQTYEVRADGVLLGCEPATVLPMAQRYFLF